MRWSSCITSNILAGTITAIIAFLFLLCVKMMIVMGEKNEEFTLQDISPAKDISFEYNAPVNPPHTNPKEPTLQETTLFHSSDTKTETETETDADDRLQVEYHIIVASFRNLTLAQGKAEKFKNDFNLNFNLFLSTEGNYRISCGKYSSLEEAEAIIRSIRKNITSDAWILSVKN